MRFGSVLVLQVLLLGGGCQLARAESPPVRSEQCQLAIHAYRADWQSAESQRSLQRACFAGSGRAPVLQAPLVVDSTRPAVTAPVTPAMPDIVLPSAPGVLTQCDAGGCWDSQGRRYRGTGPVYSGPGGAVCMRNGDRIECR